MLIEQLNVVRTRRKGAKWYCAFKKKYVQRNESQRLTLKADTVSGRAYELSVSLLFC